MGLPSTTARWKRRVPRDEFHRFSASLLNLYSARRIPSGFLTITSQLDSAPTAITSAADTTTPSRLTEGMKCQSIFKACLLIAHVNAIAADDPSAPASSPRTPYSTSSVATINFFFAPSVLRIGDS